MTNPTPPTFADHFSAHAALYAECRPTYPTALFEWLRDQCVSTDTAWDAGCGNGQAALPLSERFDHVIATDPSATQIASASKRPNIDYRVEPAESPSLPDHSVDLVTVAQALHWFDQTRFHTAVQRVLRPNGVFAAWTYELCEVGDPAIDIPMLQLYRDILGPYWPPERHHVETGYRELPFPYRPIYAPTFEMRHAWTLEQYVGYLRSWSASQRYRQANGVDPLATIEPALRAAWGEPGQTRAVRWPLVVKVGHWK